MTGKIATFMRHLCVFFWLLLFSALAQTPPTTTATVGSGAPNDGIQSDFINAYFRGGFNTLVFATPIDDVKAFGTGGYVQEFQNRDRTSGVRLALIRGNTIVSGGGQVSTFQVLHPLYNYYSTVGVKNAGFPVADTASNRSDDGLYSYQYQAFGTAYLLFAWSEPAATLPAGGETNITLKDDNFRRWVQLGGLGIIGPPMSNEAAVSSKFGTNANQQLFVAGALYAITNGTFSGKLYAVRAPVYEVYRAAGGSQSSLGLPQGDEVTLPDGRRRQVFEGGTVQYVPGQTPTVLNRVSSVTILGTTPLRLNLGETATLEARLFTIAGELVADRDVAWSTTNSRVATIQGTGAKVTLRTVGGGTAAVTATSEGRVSAPVIVFVTAPCCAIGEGAPTTSISQSLNDAAARNRLTLKLPTSSPVRRVGTGYVQDFVTADGATRVLLVKPDSSAVAYAVTGALLAVYEAQGGVTGQLGFPASDATATGRQSFENQGALGGNPPRAVTGAILARWAALGYEAGALGEPTSDAATFFSFAATSGAGQGFRNGVVYAHGSGANSGKAYVVSGVILAKYNSLGAPSGRLGLPVSDEFALGGKRRQEFEGGTADYTPGDAEATITDKARQPAVNASPGVVVSGNRVRVNISGFADNARLRVSVSGAPDFTVIAATGSYSWETVVPAGTRSGTVTVRAVDMASTTATAQASYTVRALADTRLTMEKTRGDAQVGAPGAVLPLGLRVRVRDEFGNAVAGQTVRYEASPGVTLLNATAVTDAAGEAEAFLRLPPGEGVALATASSGGQVTTFSARGAAVSLANFPRFSATADAGALVAASASVVRHLQNTGELPQPSGLADVATLNQFLKAFCAYDATGNAVCDGFLSEQIPNPFRLAAFVGGNLDVEPVGATVAAIRDRVAAGQPVIVALGSDFAVATGVGADGAVLLSNGAALAGQAGIASAFRLAPRAPPPGGFLVTSSAPVTITSPAGVCGMPLALSSLRLHFCPGTSAAYQLDIAGAAVFTDYASGGARTELTAAPSSFDVGRAGAYWTVTPLATEFSAASVVNGASFLPGIAPGGIAAIFGTGLAKAGETPVVEINGVAQQVLFASPFQVNIVLAATTFPGPATLEVKSGFGSLQQRVDIAATAPGIFSLGANPAIRGGALEVYGTGFGQTQAQGSLQTTVVPVQAWIDGRELPVLFSGLTPGFVGLYQINVSVVSDLPPGIGRKLVLRQGVTESNPFVVAVQ